MEPNRTTLDILSLGEAMIEFNAEGPARAGTAYVQGYGGDTSNVAIAAARQGARAGYLTALGADLFGDALLELWHKEGVDASFVKRRDDAPTGIYFVTHAEDGHHFTYYRAGSAASRMGPGDITATTIGSARILHLSGISQAISATAEAAAAEAIAQARRLGVKVSYDPNLRLKLWPLERARAVIHETMSRVDIALPSLEDAKILSQRDSADDILDFYLGLGAPLVVLKLGREGCLVGTARARRRIPGHRVQSVDATGAGDTFVGSFLARLSLGDNPIDAALYANASAAISTTGYGAVAPIPTQPVVEHFLAETGSKIAS